MANVTAAGRESAAKVQEQRMKMEAGEISGEEPRSEEGGGRGGGGGGGGGRGIMMSGLRPLGGRALQSERHAADSLPSSPEVHSCSSASTNSSRARCLFAGAIPSLSLEASVHVDQGLLLQKINHCTDVFSQRTLVHCLSPPAPPAAR